MRAPYGFVERNFHLVRRYWGWEGTIEYTFMAPVPRITHMMGQTAFSRLYGLWHTAVILGVVALFFRLNLGGANLWDGLLVLLAGSLSFVGRGIVAAIMPLLFPGGAHR
jgi:ABC-2 type transport system permease protein